MSSTLTLYHVLSIIYYIILFLPYLVGFFRKYGFFWTITENTCNPYYPLPFWYCSHERLLLSGKYAHPPGRTSAAGQRPESPHQSGKARLARLISCWKMKAALQTFWKRQRMPRSGTDYIKSTGYSSVWKRTAIPPAEREGLFHSLEGSLSLFLTKINSDCPAVSQLQ